MDKNVAVVGIAVEVAVIVAGTVVMVRSNRNSGPTLRFPGSPQGPDPACAAAPRSVGSGFSGSPQPAAGSHGPHTPA